MANRKFTAVVTVHVRMDVEISDERMAEIKQIEDKNPGSIVRPDEELPFWYHSVLDRIQDEMLTVVTSSPENFGSDPDVGVYLDDAEEVRSN